MFISKTDTPHYLYGSTFNNVADEMAVFEKAESSGIFQEIEKVNNSLATDPFQEYICPGHNRFFHHYVSKERGKKKAQEYLQRVFYPNRGIKEARYEIINKDSIKGKESGYFRGLNKIYNHVVIIFFRHKDNSLSCPDHPFHDTHKPT